MLSKNPSIVLKARAKIIEKMIQNSEQFRDGGEIKMYVNDSQTTKSKYYTFVQSNKKVKIRLSDHPSNALLSDADIELSLNTPIEKIKSIANELLSKMPDKKIVSIGDKVGEFTIEGIASSVNGMQIEVSYLTKKKYPAKYFNGDYLEKYFDKNQGRDMVVAYGKTISYIPQDRFERQNDVIFVRNKKHETIMETGGEISKCDIRLVTTQKFIVDGEIQLKEIYENDNNDCTLQLLYTDKTKDLFQIAGLFVSKTKRNKGLGSELISFSKNRASELGFSEIVYLVADYNGKEYNDLISFCKNNGFEFVKGSTRKMIFKINNNDIMNNNYIMQGGGSVGTNAEYDKAVSDLHKAEKLQNIMKTANSIIRSKKNVTARLVSEAGLTESNAYQIQQPDYAGRVGFATYQLTNNNANIKRLQERVKMLEGKLAGAEKGNVEYSFDKDGGGIIVINYDIDRVQIKYNSSRVPLDVHNKMRHSGYVYSPSNKAYQRKITPQAISNAIYLMGAKKEGEEKQEIVNKALEVEDKNIGIASEEVIYPNSQDEADLDIDESYDVEKGRKLKLIFENFYPELKKEFDIKNYSMQGLNPFIVFNNGATGNIDLTRQAKPEGFSPSIREKLKGISEFLLSKLNMSDYEKELNRQHEAGEIKDKDSGISLYHLSKEVNKPQKKYVKLKRDFNGISAGTIGEVLKTPNMFVKEVSFDGKIMTVDNYYTEKAELEATPKEVELPKEESRIEFLKREITNANKLLDKWSYTGDRKGVEEKINQWKAELDKLENKPQTLKEYHEGVNEANERMYVPNMPVKEGGYSIEEAEKFKEDYRASESEKIFKGVNHEYKNQYELNKAIEELLDSKADNYSTDEKNFIRKYSGYGGLDKYGKTGKGGLFEYYTPKEVIEKMWALAYKFGYDNGAMLEPSIATGEFLRYAPANIRMVGYEINPYSAKICKILYPTAEINLQPFEQTFIKNNYTVKDKIDHLEKYKLVIGNPPYGDFSVVESRYMSGMGEKDFTKARNYVEYFIRRGMDLLESGGLLIYIVGSQLKAGGKMFLDGDLTPVKEWLSENAIFETAYRLPDTIFERTGVTADIIVLRKK